MIQTIEAIIEPNGKVLLLESVQVKGRDGRLLLF